MTYKTILVHLDTSRRCAARAALAAQWARAHGSHLVGLVPTGLYDGIIPADAIAVGATDYIAESAAFLRQRAERISSEFRKQLGDCANGNLSYEVRVVDGTAIDAVVEHGRTSDLVLVGQHDAQDESTTSVLHDLPQRVLLEVGRPVLVLPYAGRFDGIPKRALVAWDGSRESAVAMCAALPALQRASSVTLVNYQRPQRLLERADLLVPETLQFLRRHGVQASIENSVSDIEAADSLLSRITDLDADLLVMGAWGHSRLRELMLGGATRQILAQMTAPVLMAS